MQKYITLHNSGGPTSVSPITLSVKTTFVLGLLVLQNNILTLETRKKVKKSSIQMKSEVFFHLSSMPFLTLSCKGLTVKNKESFLTTTVDPLIGPSMRSQMVILEIRICNYINFL